MEFEYLHSDKSIYGGPNPTLSWSKCKENNLKWLVILDGCGIYKNGRYQIELTFATNHLKKEPSVKFLTQLYHLNISEEGILSPALLKV